MDFKGRHIISIKQFTREELDYILQVANKMEKYYQTSSDLLRGKILATLFFEPSTRTRLSFTSAMYKLGGQVISLSNPEMSSISKGENLSDTISVVQYYADVIVLRHKLEGSAKLMSEISQVPIISGGSGTKEHPTQAMLDLLTIHNEMNGKLDGLKVALCGDLKYGRTVKSLAYALSHYNIEINFVSPSSLRMRNEVISDLKNLNVSINEYADLSEIINDMDVVYATRIQKERFPDPADYAKVKGSYRITVDMLDNVKENLIIMHPLPRVEEIEYEVDKTKHARYFKQSYYGVILRMALLALVLGVSL
ncbi:MAG: aspartate carbamoyltransferase [Candidatus Helarchaeota archaeon]|nr:aspartate carbamoyltransferase [Candidatus Helarchaeota archaeon]